MSSCFSSILWLKLSCLFLPTRHTVRESYVAHATWRGIRVPLLIFRLSRTVEVPARVASPRENSYGTNAVSDGTSSSFSFRAVSCFDL